MTQSLMFVGDDYVATLERGGGIRADGQISLEQALSELRLDVDQLRIGWYNRATREFIGEMLPDVDV